MAMERFSFVLYYAFYIGTKKARIEISIYCIIKVKETKKNLHLHSVQKKKKLNCWEIYTREKITIQKEKVARHVS